MKSEPLAIPTIHTNGTPKDTLIDCYLDAIMVLHDAGSALARTYPNARDYYTQGSGATSVAMDQHEARMFQLREIIKELQQLVEAIQ